MAQDMLERTAAGKRDGKQVGKPEADIPEPLQGLGSTVIVTGLMALEFMGFTGMVELG